MLRAFTVLVLVLAVIGPIIAGDAARGVSVDSALLPPSVSHPLGTDQLGRDVLARLVVGARTCVLGALLITVLTAVLSTVIGLFAGYFGGWFDAVVSRLVDVVYSLPNLLVAIVVVGVLGGGYALAIAVLVVLAVPYNVRYIRAATLEQRGLPYIEAARGLGLSRTTIARRHILPQPEHRHHLDRCAALHLRGRRFGHHLVPGAGRSPRYSGLGRDAV